MRQSNVVVASTLLAAALAAAATVAAQTRPGAQPKPAIPELAPGLSSKPYSRLFNQQLSEATAALRAKVESLGPNSARRFICTMPVLPSDSTIDPKFEMGPRDTTTRFSIRVVSPSVCP